jgi:hypothetical protein
MGGAVGRVPDSGTAFPERSMPFVLNAVAGWHEADQGSAPQAWAPAVISESASASTRRACVNFLADSDSTMSSYGEQTYARLATLKRRYDPTNLFRLNHNIEPIQSS